MLLLYYQGVIQRGRGRPGISPQHFDKYDVIVVGGRNNIVSSGLEYYLRKALVPLSTVAAMSAR